MLKKVTYSFVNTVDLINNYSLYVLWWFVFSSIVWWFVCIIM